MAEMNPYNFVRVRPMANNSRQQPLGHKAFVTDHNGEKVYSGRLQCQLINFSPFIILSHMPGDKTESSSKHKTFNRFFHYPNDLRPVIPATALKGMVRSIAEAASNSCFAILNEKYVKRWDNFADAYPPSLRFCGRSDVALSTPYEVGEPPLLCPTCRIFGTAAEGEESGSSERSAYPRAFQGKVQFSDAIFQGDVHEGIYQPAQTLIPLLEPKVSQHVWYHDPARASKGDSVSGRKFYYHHDDLIAKTSDAKNEYNSTLRPLQPGGQFTFQIEFRNLLTSELALFLYALELEPAMDLIQIQEKTIHFNWQQVRDSIGSYPKLGYGKPAGLGSVCVLATHIMLHNPLARYGIEEGNVERRYSGNNARDFVNRLKLHFDKTLTETKNGITRQPVYYNDLRNILRFPNRIQHFRYPSLSPEFRRYKNNYIKLPLPGQELNWSL